MELTEKAGYVIASSALLANLLSNCPPYDSVEKRENDSVAQAEDLNEPVDPRLDELVFDGGSDGGDAGFDAGNSGDAGVGDRHDNGADAAPDAGESDNDESGFWKLPASREFVRKKIVCVIDGVGDGTMSKMIDGQDAYCRSFEDLSDDERIDFEGSYITVRVPTPEGILKQTAAKFGGQFDALKVLRPGEKIPSE